MGRKKGNDKRRTSRALDRLKMETAEQLGLDDDMRDADELSVREAGRVGGQMVKKLVKKGERAIAKESAKKARKSL